MPKTENAASSPGAHESLLREKLIDAARDGWTNGLVDLSRRNNLLFYKPVASGTLELPVTEKMMAFLSEGEALPLSELLASNQEKISAVRAISRKGLESRRKRTINSLSGTGPVY